VTPVATTPAPHLRRTRSTDVRTDVQEEPTVVGCACGAADESGEHRHAVAVDPDIKARNVKRLRRIEGQIRGLQKMVDDDRYCADIMMQISSVTRRCVLLDAS